MFFVLLAEEASLKHLQFEQPFWQDLEELFVDNMKFSWNMHASTLGPNFMAKIFTANSEMTAINANHCRFMHEADECADNFRDCLAVCRNLEGLLHEKLMADKENYLSLP